MDIKLKVSSCIGCLVLFCCNVISNDKEAIFSISSKHEINTQVFNENSYILFNNLLIEPVKHINKIYQGGEVSVSDSLTGFFIWNFNDKMIYNFDSNHNYKDSTKFKDKNIGLAYYEEFPNIQSYVNKFKLEKDTLIDDINHKKLVYTSPENYVVVLLNTSLNKNFKFHPISTYLDKKYNGICTDIQLIHKNYQIKIKWDIQEIPELGEQEKSLFKEFFSLFK